MTKLEEKVKDGHEIAINYIDKEFHATLRTLQVNNSHSIIIASTKSKISTLNALFFLEQKLEYEFNAEKTLINIAEENGIINKGDLEQK